MRIASWDDLFRRRFWGYWAPSMPEIAAGAAFLAIASGMLAWSPAPDAQSFKQGVIGMTTVIGVILVVIGFLRRTPAHAYESAWEEQWNALRKAARPFGDALDAAWLSWRKGHPEEDKLPVDWRDLASDVRWPEVDGTPFAERSDYLTTRAPWSVQKYYGFLRAIEQLSEIVAFRQFGTDTLAFFGRRIGATGVESFLLDVNAKQGFRDIIIALAYLNIAIAIRQSSSDPDNVQSGFWSLGERWYPPLLKLRATERSFPSA